MQAPPVTLEQLQLLLLQIRPDDPQDAPFTMRTRFVEDLGLKSLELTGFVFVCEQHFGVTLFDRPGLLANLLTVGATLRAIDQLQRGASEVDLSDTAMPEAVRAS